MKQIVLWACWFWVGGVALAGEMFDWKPVRLGAGGFVTGFVTHPLDAKVRYCRTDVGNAYRWDGTEWRPMVVRGEGTGMPQEMAASPAVCGVDSIAIDPSDPKVVLLSMKASRPDMMKAAGARDGGNIYRSVDGGVNFSAGDLAVEMDANGRWRTEGERLKVSPHDGKVVYYGSLKDGLWRSDDSGLKWKAVRGARAPAANANVLAVHFGKLRKEIAEVFAVIAQGAVLRSIDGGVTWNDISAGTALAGKCVGSTMDAAGVLHVMAAGSRDVWNWQDGDWKKMLVDLDWNSPPHALAFDPRNVARVYAISDGGGISRSLDGGKTWTLLGPNITFAGKWGWLPQEVGYRSNAGIFIDAGGTLWIAQGNEGMLRCEATDAETSAKPPGWMIDSTGIEEFVTHDVMVPPGGSAVFAVEDATGLVSADVTKFVARQIPLQDQLISNGTGLAYCPNAPEYLAIVTADVNFTHSGKSYSGYSADSGKTWTKFAGLPMGADKKPLQPAGSIAISRRGDWKTGADHLVWLPTGAGPTFFSKDGGATWQASEGFPLNNGYWQFSLKQRQLAADPIVVDKFYFVGSWGGGFYVSVDGGKSWKVQEKAGLPHFNHHGQLATNRAVAGDLWFCDGWDGASEHGLWHSRDGGKQFVKDPAVEFALTLCTGKGSGDGGYSVYFYGKLNDDREWGIFRADGAGAADGGAKEGGPKWLRVAKYPAGIFDQPTCMAASWDEFGKVIVGFGGNSFVVGRGGEVSRK